jgi:RNA polymerase sigma factor (sigma-70 family)
MFIKAGQKELLWELAAVGESAEVSQQWILSAMQKQGPALVSILWRILGNEQDVCDAYQDTFLKLAHQNFGRKPDNVKAYLFRTASNIAISMLRRRKHHDDACRHLVSLNSSPKQSDLIADLDLKELQENIRCHIARLPEYLRNVVVLRDLGELSYQEIARILGISSSTARVYRCRAIQILAVMMGNGKINKS